MKKRTEYFAYGANTNLSAMQYRCPNARPLGLAVLKNWRLVFRGVADIVPAKGYEVHGALWEITAECEQALDRFEGYPSLYVKSHVRARALAVPGVKPVMVDAMVYLMRVMSDVEVPSPFYEETLRAGYVAHGIPVLQLDEAIRRAQSSMARRYDRRPGTTLGLLG